MHVQSKFVTDNNHKFTKQTDETPQPLYMASLDQTPNISGLEHQVLRPLASNGEGRFFNDQIQIKPFFC